MNRLHRAGNGRRYGIRTAWEAGIGYGDGMKSYGQFCSVARALDLLGERWTILIVRELLFGSARFNDLRRGIPRISRTMLSARLRELFDGGVIRRDELPSGPSYTLTQAGLELAGAVRELGTWGQRWLPRELPRQELDAPMLLWDIRRRIRKDSLPQRPIVARIEISDLRGVQKLHFLLLRRDEVSLCSENPGFAVELIVSATLPILTAWWRGDLSLAAARAAGMSIAGRREWVRAFPKWFERYLFADVTPTAAR
jgi:DNA-binding HxlR family transcriptional regulator